MKDAKFNIIATVNSHKIEKQFIANLYKSGATIIRLNAVHVKLGDIDKSVQLIRNTAAGSKLRILVDLPGNKIRTNNIYQNIALKINECFELGASNFNFDSFMEYLNKGDIILSSDGQLKMRVEQRGGGRVVLRALTSGELQNNKGMHLPDKSLAHLPFLFERDLNIIEQCKKSGVDLIGFSFVRSPENVKQALTILGRSGLSPIFKLETKEVTSQKCLDAIVNLGSSFLIDRGDLLSEVGILKFPRVFNSIANRVQKARKELFVATQLFASMYRNNVPFISEVMEFHRLLQMGITGFQLSEEVAIGLHPLEVLKLMRDIRMEGKA